MSDYTPTEKDVRLTFAYIQGGLDHDDGYEPFYQVHEEEFDRFIRKVRAEAWDECADVAGDLKGEFGEPFSTDLRDANPYRESE